MGRERLDVNAPRLRDELRPPDSGPWLEDVMLGLKANTNLLLCGESRRVESVLDWLTPMLARPLIVSQPGRALVLPRADRCGTLVLREIEKLSPRDQARLDAWYKRSPSSTRIVCTATQSLIPLIDSGAFLERLYYRLNTVFASVSPP